MKLALFVIALLPLEASTINVQEISFTRTVSGQASAGEGLSWPWYANPSAILSDSISVDAYSNNQGMVYASASMSFVEQITITGGSGTGIAVACANTSYQMMRDQWYGSPYLSIVMGMMGPQETGDYSDECPANHIPGGQSLETSAVDFAYVVPFDMNVTVSADASAIGYGDEESLTAQSQFFIVDPPGPPSVPEPATVSMFGIGTGVLLLYSHHKGKGGLNFPAPATLP